MMRKRTVILVPWRTDNAQRAKAWAVCRQRWAALFPEWTIYEGVSPEGPFNRSAAINHAARLAGEWDVALVIDADVMLARSNVIAAVETAYATGKVTWAHRRWRGMSEEATERLTRPDPGWTEGALGIGGVASPDFAGADIDLIVEKTTRLSWSCCIAIRRDAWEALDGFDERFAGWGFEDGAFAAAAMGLVGHARIEGDVLNLWHPRLPGAGKADRDAQNRHTPQALVNGRLGMRYMLALRRDYGLTDRPEAAGPDELARDIGNLRGQDAKFALDQPVDRRKAYDDWWPTLEELRDGAREYREQRATSVTVIVHTGGKAENWPTRGEYLRQSLESLAANVTGPIIQRVVYDCWGDARIREQIQAMAEPLGFYVVGPAERPDYTASMRAMWRYLARRAQGAYVFQSEDDFLFERPIDLEPMIEALADNPHLTQMALLRDACYADERETGGVLGWPEPAFERKAQWAEHRLFWTANPSLFRKSLTAVPWPIGNHSETLFGKAVFRDPGARSAFWGDLSTNWITHIGEVRAGSGY